MKEWRVTDCITEFSQLVEKVFNPRSLRIPGLHYARMVKRRSKYRSAPIEEALKSAFGEDMHLFGDTIGPTKFNIKVAITSTTATSDAGVVMANYNRSEGKTKVAGLPKTMRFDRALTVGEELLVWEA